VAVRPQLQVRATRIDVDMRLLGAPAVVAIPLDPDCRRRRDGRRARRSRGHRLPGPMHGAQPVVGREGLAPLGPAYRHGPLLLRAGIRATGVNASARPPGHASFRLIALAYPAKTAFPRLRRRACDRRTQPADQAVNRNGSSTVATSVRSTDATTLSSWIVLHLSSSAKSIITILGMKALSTGPFECTRPSSAAVIRSWIDAYRPLVHSFFSDCRLTLVHIVSLRWRMLSKMPVVVQYIIPMTSGPQPTPLRIRLFCFCLFWEVLKNGLKMLVPPLPKYCSPSNSRSKAPPPLRFWKARMPCAPGSSSPVASRPDCENSTTTLPRSS